MRRHGLGCEVPNLTGPGTDGCGAERIRPVLRTEDCFVRPGQPSQCYLTSKGARAGKQINETKPKRKWSVEGDILGGHPSAMIEG